MGTSSPNLGYVLGGPHSEDYSILGSILGPALYGNCHISKNFPQQITINDNKGF